MFVVIVEYDQRENVLGAFTRLHEAEEVCVQLLQQMTDRYETLAIVQVEVNPPSIENHTDHVVGYLAREDSGAGRHQRFMGYVQQTIDGIWYCRANWPIEISDPMHQFAYSLLAGDPVAVDAANDVLLGK